MRKQKRPPENLPTPEQPEWALVRLVLGLLQMGGAVAAFCLLAQTGVSATTVGVTLLTCACTTLSVLLFGARKR
jgi:hypothetical protein